jgi:hypothetical protein
LIFYVLGTFGFLASTVLTVIMLLCVGEISTDSGCEEFLRRVAGVMSWHLLANISPTGALKFMAQ